MKDIESILIELRGTKLLLSLLLDSITDGDTEKFAALVAIENQLDTNVKELEQAVYNR